MGEQEDGGDNEKMDKGLEKMKCCHQTHGTHAYLHLQILKQTYTDTHTYRHTDACLRPHTHSGVAVGTLKCVSLLTQTKVVHIERL